MTKQVITRFAPSPTGYLHIGGARTALFNYLFAKHHGGQFLLRIEDTDIARSTKEAVNAILNGLTWLGLNPSSAPVFQMQNQKSHIKHAFQLLETGNAYKCFCTKEDLDAKRKKAENDGKAYTYDRTCRSLNPKDHPKDRPFTIRVKSALDGETSIEDLVMGKIKVQNKTLDDFIILRTDQTPTYMFAVVVDDHEMSISHVIRGDDHLTNTFRQIQIYNAFGWDIPDFAHLPLIYSPDGSKMSKRHGAVAVEDYKDMGFLPDAILNYLLLLGWSYGVEEIISLEKATEIFSITDVNKSPSRFDIDKLKNINFQYIRNTKNEDLFPILEEIIEKKYTKESLHPKYKFYLLKGLNPIKDRAKTTLDLVEKAEMYLLKFPLPNLGSKEVQILKDSSRIIQEDIELIKTCKDFNRDNLHNIIKDYAEKNNLKLGKATEGLRVLLSGSSVSAASVFDIMETIGLEETLIRLKYFYHYSEDV